MGTVKESQLKNNVDMAVEREMRQIEEVQHRERQPGEKERLREKWERSAQRIDKSGKLAEIWNDKPEEETINNRPEFGYFSGVNFDKNGKIIR